MTVSFLEAVASLLAAVAWPLALLAIVWVFRDPLRDLLQGNDIALTAGGVTLTAKRQVAATDALTKAAAEKGASPISKDRIAIDVHATSLEMDRLARSPRLLWVDDTPTNNNYERRALEALGATIELAVSTEQALDKIRASGSYDVIISDMGRPTDPRAGYTLLGELRDSGILTPYVIYAGSAAPDHVAEAVRRGAVGCTNDPNELLRLVSTALRTR